MKTFFWLSLFVSVLLLESLEAARGGRGGGGRRSGSSGRSRSSGSKSGGSTRRMKYGPYGTSRVTKYTYIPVRSKTSPVIVKQTKIGSRSNLGTRVFVGYMFYRYSIHNGPVYRQRYPTYRGEVTIPEERAIRVTGTEEQLFDTKGSFCIGPNDKRNLMADINERVSLVITTVKYGDKPGMVYIGDNRTIDIDKSVLDQDVNVQTIVKYNGSIIENSNCTQMKSVMNGTVIRLYATNPDNAGILSSSYLVVLLSIIVYFLSIIE